MNIKKINNPITKHKQTENYFEILTYTSQKS